MASLLGVALALAAARAAPSCSGSHNAVPVVLGMTAITGSRNLQPALKLKQSPSSKQAAPLYFRVALCCEGALSGIWIRQSVSRQPGAWKHLVYHYQRIVVQSFYVPAAGSRYRECAQSFRKSIVPRERRRKALGLRAGPDN